MFKKGLKHLEEIISRIVKIFVPMEPGEIHHDDPIPVDPPIKPKEEEK